MTSTKLPRRIEIMAMTSTWGVVSVPIKVHRVSRCIGVNKDPSSDYYNVTHIPTGAAICSRYSYKAARLIATELAKRDELWDFSSQAEFANPQSEVAAIDDLIKFSAEFPNYGVSSRQLGSI